jgi:hypothetical protein
MKYRIFDTEVEAIKAEAAISAAMGFARPDGNETEDNSVTSRWAIPQQIADKRWAFPSPDEQGVEYDPKWFPEYSA